MYGFVVIALDLDFDELGHCLGVLAYPNRLELLTRLRKPQTLDDIHLKPTAAQARNNPDRSITRQAVQNHLDRLAEFDIVRVSKVKRSGERATNQYVLDPARLFALAEDVRRLASPEPTIPLEPTQTWKLREAWSTRPVAGPKLVLVHGADPGRTFPLAKAPGDGQRGWIIGRRPDVDIGLAYDPYVSEENTEIIREDNGFELLDLRTSTNGTFLNFNRLPVGGSTRLEHGDIVGVGRSQLVFHDG